MGTSLPSSIFRRPFVRLDSVDNEQYTALLKFKDSCLKRGLVQDYEDLADFRDKFGRHLAQTIIRDFANQTAGTGDLVVPRSIVPSLSDKAEDLLREAAKDQRCHLASQTMGGAIRSDQRPSVCGVRERPFRGEMVECR